jgi:hypothetical protein
MKRMLAVSFACVLAMVLALPGAGHAKRPDPTAQCQSKKVNAATIFVKKLFYAQAAELKNPDEFDLDAAVAEAEGQFEERWEAAEATDDCDFPFNQDIDIPSDESPVNFADVVELMDWIEGEVEGIAALITDGVDDPKDKDLVNLGAELLRAAGQKAFSLLKAEAQNLQQPNDGKRERARQRAMNSYERTYEKRVQKAQAKGVDVSEFTDDSDPRDGKYDLLVDSEQEIDWLVQDIVTIFTTIPNPA